jgi:hypothetical protein
LQFGQSEKGGVILCTTRDNCRHVFHRRGRHGSQRWPRHDRHLVTDATMPRNHQNCKDSFGVQKGRDTGDTARHDSALGAAHAEGCTQTWMCHTTDSRLEPNAVIAVLGAYTEQLLQQVSASLSGDRIRLLSGELCSKAAHSFDGGMCYKFVICGVNKLSCCCHLVTLWYAIQPVCCTNPARSFISAPVTGLNPMSCCCLAAQSDGWPWRK